jgi:hypothetical protein
MGKEDGAYLYIHAGREGSFHCKYVPQAQNLAVASCKCLSAIIEQSPIVTCTWMGVGVGVSRTFPSTIIHLWQCHLTLKPYCQPMMLMAAKNEGHMLICCDSGQCMPSDANVVC